MSAILAHIDEVYLAMVRRLRPEDPNYYPDLDRIMDLRELSRKRTVEYAQTEEEDYVEIQIDR